MRYRLNPERLIWQEVEGEIIAVDLALSNYMSANPTAATMWPLLVKGASDDELVSAILERFEAEEPQVRADVQAFVDALLEHDMLVRE